MGVAPDSLICRAIHARSLLVFEYDGHLRVVAPYCHGTSKTGLETVRAVQLAGSSSSGRGLGFGKLWSVVKMKDLRDTGQRFVPDDPGYKPDDSAMLAIHCRIE